MHSQAMIRSTAEAKQCRTHAEEMHSRKTGLHYVGLEEKTRSKQCRHTKPDLQCECSLKKLPDESCFMLGKAAVALARRRTGARFSQRQLHAL